MGICHAHHSNSFGEVAMDEKNMGLEAIKLVYGDIAKPGLSQIGKAIGAPLTYWCNRIVGKYDLMNAKYEICKQKHLDDFRRQLESTPLEKICEVRPEIGVPIIEKLSYVTDEDLSRLYVNLLAKASTEDTVGQAHPAFIDIINNMSPIEAVILNRLKGEEEIPFIIAINRVLSGEEKGGFTRYPDININNKYFSNLNLSDRIVTISLINLDRLGIIKIDEERYFAKEDRYSELISHYHPVYSKLPINKQTHKLEFKQGVIGITQFGKLFIKACCTSLTDSPTT